MHLSNIVLKSMHTQYLATEGTFRGINGKIDGVCSIIQNFILLLAIVVALPFPS